MLSDFQLFADTNKAVRAGLTGAVGIDFGKVHSSLPTNPFCQRQELSEGGINTIFSQHPPCQSFDIEVFCKDGLRLVTKLMSRLEMEIFTTVGNPMVHSGNFDLCLLPVLRTLLFSCRSALQQFQLALHRLEKLRTLLEAAIRSRQESLQSEVNSNPSTVNWSIGKRYPRFDSNDDIPLRSSHLGQYPNLLHLEPVRNGAMQVDGYCPDLGQSVCSMASG